MTKVGTIFSIFLTIGPKIEIHCSNSVEKKNLNSINKAACLNFLEKE